MQNTKPHFKETPKQVKNKVIDYYSGHMVILKLWDSTPLHIDTVDYSHREKNQIELNPPRRS